MSPEAEVKLICSVLDAYIDPRVCWGITKLGWETYANHWSDKVRNKVAAHPYRFQPISYSPNRVQCPAA